VNFLENFSYIAVYKFVPGDQEELFKLAVHLRKFFNSVIYNTATGYVLLVYLTNILYRYSINNDKSPTTGSYSCYTI
jgi:hypothetical protein